MGGDLIVLRHRDAIGQARIFGAFTGLLVAIPLAAFVFDAAPKWWLLALALPAAVTGYSTLRLLTLRVLLDENGVNEPAPFRPTVVTPWDDLVRVRRTEEKGAIGLTFLGIAVEHRGGWKHQITALTINTRDPSAEQTIDEWIAAIRDAQRHYTR